VDETVLSDHVLLPGLINMHTHSPMSLLRGYADDMDMQDWLANKIWPVEDRLVSRSFVADGTRLAIAEMIRSGTTCFNENYFFPESILETVQDSGIRASIGLPVIDVPNKWAKSAVQCLEKDRELFASSAPSDRIHFALAPHAPYTVSDDAFIEIGQLSAEWDIPVHLHLLETGYDLVHSMEHYSEKPLQRLKRLGLLNNRLLAVHMTQLDPVDIDLLAESGVHVIHCPRSNLKLASGFCPVGQLLEAGVNVAVGTDGAASNNRLDMLSETQFAALLAKGLSGDASSVDAFTMLEMMTLNGAKALGQEDELGTIEPGKWADLAALNLAFPETSPVHNVVSQIAYSASSRQFTDVWVAGKPVLKAGSLTGIDLPAVLSNAEKWRELIASPSGQDKQENHQ
jgi:5-methylthioadenosine/S-adenosylhomocysteine deaminase